MSENQPQSPSIPTGAGVVNEIPKSDVTKTKPVLGPGNTGGPTVAELMKEIAALKAMMKQGAQAVPEEEQLPRELKTYFHRNPGSVIYVNKRGPRGDNQAVMFQFNALGELTTDDPDAQDFLDELVDRPGVPIYSKQVQGVDPELAATAAAVKANAERSIDRLQRN